MALLASVVAVVLFGVGAVLFVVFRTPSITAVPGAPKSITVHGTKLPYVGQVPWANAVADPHDPSVVYVFADNDAVHAAVDTCFAEADRAVAHHSGDAVEVTVAGYGHPLTDGEACPGLAHLPAPVRVELPGPLGQRSLVDASGTAHRVLDPSTVPAPGRLRPGCKEWPLQWDESTGIAIRSYYSGKAPFSWRCATLTFGATPQMSKQESRPPPTSRSVRIGGKAGRIWTEPYGRPRTTQVTVVWAFGRHTRIDLVVDAPKDRTIGPGYALAIARSVR